MPGQLAGHYELIWITCSKESFKDCPGLSWCDVSYYKISLCNCKTWPYGRSRQLGGSRENISNLRVKGIIANQVDCI